MRTRGDYAGRGFAVRLIGPAHAVGSRERCASGCARNDHRERPVPTVRGVVRWRIVDLCQWGREEFRVVVAKQPLSRELRAISYREISARPVMTRRPPAPSRISKKVAPSA
jgi:hypothetical protein